MSSQNLVKMANDIGRFFASEPQRADAVAGIATHLRRSWDPRMLRKIAAIAREGGGGLDELPLEAVLSLQIPDAPASTSTSTSTSGMAPAASPAGASPGGAGH